MRTSIPRVQVPMHRPLAVTVRSDVVPRSTVAVERGSGFDWVTTTLAPASETVTESAGDPNPERDRTVMCTSWGTVPWTTLSTLAGGPASRMGADVVADAPLAPT